MLEISRKSYELSQLEIKEQDFDAELAKIRHKIATSSIPVPFRYLLYEIYLEIQLKRVRKKISEVQSELSEPREELRECNESESGSGGGG